MKKLILLVLCLSTAIAAFGKPPVFEKKSKDPKDPYNRRAVYCPQGHPVDKEGYCNCLGCPYSREYRGYDPSLLR